MKLSTVHMAIGLVAIVTLSYYFNREGFSVPRVVPFELEQFSKIQETFVVPSPSLSTVPSTVPYSVPYSVPKNPVVSVSDTSYQAMTSKQRSDLLRDIQKMVRDEMLMKRQLDTLNGQEQDHDHEQDHEHDHEEDNQSCESQGQDFNRRRPQEQEQEEEDIYRRRIQEQNTRCPRYPDGTCPPVPDLSQYIRKDQIPCWGCSVDY